MDLFKSTRLSRTKITRAISICIFTLAIQACESPGSSSSSNLNSNPYLSNSEISVSNNTLSVGSTVTVTLVLKNDAGQTVTDAQPEVYFYYYGGTCQGYFSPVVYHVGGTYTSTFTAAEPGSISTIHAKINSEEILGIKGLPTVKIPGGLPTSISVLSGTGQTAHGLTLLPIPFSVLVKDASGTVVQGATVEWRVASGSASFNPSSTITNADGIAVTQVTLGSKGGVNSITATPLATTLTANFSATATTTAFLQTWVLDVPNSSSYTFDPARIEFSGSVCRLKQTIQMDQDNTAAGFGGGTLSGVAWDSTNQSIRLGSAGGCDGTLSNCSPLAELASDWTPQWSSLVGYWKLNDLTGGSFVDSSFSVRNGAKNGSVTMGVAGHQRLGAYFDGVNGNYVHLPFNQIGLTAVSWAVWFKTADSGVILSEANVPAYGNPGSWNPFLRVDINGYLRGYFYDGGSIPVQGATSAQKVNDGLWHHAVFVANSSGQKIYVDGTLSGTGNAPGIIGLSNLEIGTGYTSSWANGNGTWHNYKGTLDDLALWKTALTPAEILTIFNRQSTAHGGVLSSRIFDAGSPSANWTNIAWTSTLPFFKPLPDAGSSESKADYTALANSTLMNGIQGLWHFEDTAPGATPGGKDFLDSSGNGAHGTKSSAVTLASKGVIKLAAATNGQGINMPVAIGTTMTLSLWATSKNITASPMLWRTGPDGVGPDLFFAGGIISLNTWDSSSNPYGPIPANAGDGKFHHYVTVIDGVSHTSDLYFDGVKLGSAAYRNPTATSLSLSSNVGSYEWNGLFDEAAVWNRALSATEVNQLYRRQANRILFQVRNCVASDCSDDVAGANWKGPDGSRLTTFSELNNNSTSLPNLLFANYTSPPGFSRYFQYRAILESDDYRTTCNYGAGATACSPELKATSIGPNHFDASAPTVVTNIGISSLFLTDFAETLGTACTSGVGYNIGVGTDAVSASWYYWASAKGSDCTSAGTGAWCAADGTVAQSSPAALVSANALSFGAKAGAGNVFVKAFLKSTGLANCELHQLELSGQN